MAHDATGFDDVLFPIRVDFGVEGGEELMTTITATGAGREWRNTEQNDPRGKWDAASRINTFADVDLVTAFFRARKAMTYSFRYKDFTDYTAIGAATLPAVGDGANLVFNMYKDYPDAIDTTMRRIALPIDTATYTGVFANGPLITPLVVYIDDIVVSPSIYSIDFRNGRITFTGGNAPAVGEVVTWDGEFHVAARFGTAQLSKRLVHHDVITFDELPIQEILAWDILESADA